VSTRAMAKRATKVQSMTWSHVLPQSQSQATLGQR
jgi:hypothetical protein